jgi:hypothetical protein
LTVAKRFRTGGYGVCVPAHARHYRPLAVRAYPPPPPPPACPEEAACRGYSRGELVKFILRKEDVPRWVAEDRACALLRLARELPPGQR